MYSGLPATPGGTTSCVYLATVLSFIDFIPFFYICARPPSHLTKSPPPIPFHPDNEQGQKLQTWSQLFANCSYNKNQSENIKIICFEVFDPLPVFFFSAAFALAIILLIFNLITMTRNLTIPERIFRTIVHTVYAGELFATSLIYYINRYWCFNCKELTFICLIPIITTIFMPCNWRQCNGEDQQQHQVRFGGNEQVHFLTSSRRLTPPPSRPPVNNPDPQLENEYNDWLEFHTNNTTQRQQI